MYNLKIWTVISTYSSSSSSKVWINIHSERKGDKYSSSMSLKISAKTCLQLLKASIAFTDYRTKEIVTKPRAALSKHNKYVLWYQSYRIWAQLSFVIKSQTMHCGSCLVTYNQLLPHFDIVNFMNLPGIQCL